MPRALKSRKFPVFSLMIREFDVESSSHQTASSAIDVFIFLCMKLTATMNFLQATSSYESWMRSCATIVESDLRLKHEQMRSDLFMFFRGTFYRWAQLWPEICADLSHAPRVLACGDLHVNSFGTWRDSEGRLAWGIDDFDDSYPLPYTNDLVRLAASVKIVKDLGHLTLGLKKSCDLILQAYSAALRSGGH